MKIKLSLILTLFFSLHIFGEDQIFLVDIIFIKYLPEAQTDETFLPPELNEIDNILFLSDFPYPEIEIKSLPLDLGYRFQDLFMSVQIDDENQNLLEEEQIITDRLVPLLENKKSFFETDSARDFSLSEEVSKIARSRDFRVIGTKSWFQTVKNIDKAQNIFIDSNFFKGTRIFGFLKLYKERFLHFNLNLYLSELDPSKEQIENLISGKNFFGDDQQIDLFEEKNQSLLFQVQHSKKFRSGELHYVDHPKFGMLIKLTKAQKESFSPDNDLAKNR
tara:strand:+ start:3445 stop:4272 length:828 start_codon:yes stop_codon:yes gene_type:complete